MDYELQANLRLLVYWLITSVIIYICKYQLCQYLLLKKFNRWKG